MVLEAAASWASIGSSVRAILIGGASLMSTLEIGGAGRALSPLAVVNPDEDSLMGARSGNSVDSPFATVIMVPPPAECSAL